MKPFNEKHRVQTSGSTATLAIAFGFLLLAGLAGPSLAINRCVTPAGKVLYTDASCESAGANHQREVKDAISVIEPAVPSSGAGKPGAPAVMETRKDKKPFLKSPNSPTLVVCYDPKDARTDVSSADVEGAIRNAVSLWNAGCNVNYQFTGVCATEHTTSDRPVDYKVWWESWDDSLKIDETKTAREHAIARASPRIGVSLNREIESFKFARQYRRSIVHEFGHVVGMGHSSNRGDVMYSGGLNGTPTEIDLAACNKAIEARFDVK